MFSTTNRAIDQRYCGYDTRPTQMVYSNKTPVTKPGHLARQLTTTECMPHVHDTSHDRVGITWRRPEG